MYREFDRLIAVTNRHLCQRPFLEQLERVCRYHPKAVILREKDLTEDEINNFHLSTLKLSYEEAIREYEYRSNTRLGKLIAIENCRCCIVQKK